MDVRRVEILAMLSLATDLGMGLPFEHGLRSTLIAIRLADPMAIVAQLGLLPAAG
jgi:hypothetical protein